MESIENKIYRRIIGKGRLWCFSDNDFRDISSRGSIRLSLMRLAKKNKIRRILRGLYDYPKFSETLNQLLSPDINQAAEALARKFGWRIQPTGETALNFFGLSRQVPGKVIYLSTGPNRKYCIEINGSQLDLIFKKTSLKHSALKLPESALIVQALESLSKERFDDKTAKKIRQKFDKALLKKILLDTRSVKGWIYDCIREICLGGKDE